MDDLDGSNGDNERSKGVSNIKHAAVEREQNEHEYIRTILVKPR